MPTQGPRFAPSGCHAQSAMALVFAVLAVMTCVAASVYLARSHPGTARLEVLQASAPLGIAALLCAGNAIAIKFGKHLPRLISWGPARLLFAGPSS